VLPPDARFALPPYDFARAEALAARLGVSHVTAQLLVRRGLGDPDEARAFLAADASHPLERFGGLHEAARLVLEHVGRRSRITVHGDYDADGVCSTAILVRALWTVGADVDWFLPSRVEDGYGLAPATVERLAARGTDLLLTADCAITAVDEVALARASGMDVVVTDHHAPRADGRLPDAPIVHPRLGEYPCPDLCAAGVAHKLAAALLAGAGMDPRLAEEDLDLVALATVADVVPLVGENRRLVREGLRALAGTRKPGLRALMDVARVDPSAVDASAVGFRLAPRINAAGRLYRADAGLELVLTDDEARARAIAAELDAVNAERRDVETRIRFEAEALVAEAGPAPAYVLAAEGWHPGVIGIVASRIAERHHRPTVLVALEGETGSGSGRSIPAFDLLAGLEAGATELLRHGGHRAAAGLTIARDRVDAFRARFVAHAGAVLAPGDLAPVVPIDAVAPGDALGLPLAEELERLAPFGAGNPPPSLLVPAAQLSDPRPLGEGRHLACTLTAGGARSRAVAFGGGSTLPAATQAAVDCAVRLEVHRWGGALEPRLVLRHLRPAGPAAIDLLGEPPSFAHGVLAELGRPLDTRPLGAIGGGRERRDVRGGGIAGLLGDLVGAGERVLAIAAHAPRRVEALRERVGGFAVCSWAALADAPQLAAGFAHVVAVDPPADPRLAAVLEALPGTGWVHLAWGPPELAFAARVHAWELTLRPPLAAAYRGLRAAGSARGSACVELLAGCGTPANSPVLAGRLVRVLAELGLARVGGDAEALELTVLPVPGRAPLEGSAAWRAYEARRAAGERHLAHLAAAAQARAERPAPPLAWTA